MGNNKKVSEVTILHQLINKERRKYGLRWNKWDQWLYNECKAHSNEMAKKGKVYHTPIAMIGIAECCFGALGINHKSSPSDIFKCWMNSPGHCDAILSPTSECQAVAISRSRHGTYATFQALDPNYATSYDDTLEIIPA